MAVIDNIANYVRGLFQSPQQQSTNAATQAAISAAQTINQPSIDAVNAALQAALPIAATNLAVNTALPQFQVQQAIDLGLDTALANAAPLDLAVSTAEPIAQQQSVFDATQAAIDTANQQLLPDLAYSSAINTAENIIQEQQQVQQQADAVQQALDTTQSAIDSIAVPGYNVPEVEQLPETGIKTNKIAEIGGEIVGAYKNMLEYSPLGFITAPIRQVSDLIFNKESRDSFIDTVNTTANTANVLYKQSSIDDQLLKGIDFGGSAGTAGIRQGDFNIKREDLRTQAVQSINVIGGYLIQQTAETEKQLDTALLKGQIPVAEYNRVYADIKKSKEKYINDALSGYKADKNEIISLDTFNRLYLQANQNIANVNKTQEEIEAIKKKGTFLGVQEPKQYVFGITQGETLIDFIDKGKLLEIQKDPLKFKDLNTITITARDSIRKYDNMIAEIGKNSPELGKKLSESLKPVVEAERLYSAKFYEHLLNEGTSTEDARLYAEQELAKKFGTNDLDKVVQDNIGQYAMKGEKRVDDILFYQMVKSKAQSGDYLNGILAPFRGVTDAAASFANDFNALKGYYNNVFEKLGRNQTLDDVGLGELQTQILIKTKGGFSGAIGNLYTYLDDAALIAGGALISGGIGAGIRAAAGLGEGFTVARNIGYGKEIAAGVAESVLNQGLFLNTYMDAVINSSLGIPSTNTDQIINLLSWGAIDTTLLQGLKRTAMLGYAGKGRDSWKFNNFLKTPEYSMRAADMLTDKVLLGNDIVKENISKMTLRDADILRQQLSYFNQSINLGIRSGAVDKEVMDAFLKREYLKEAYNGTITQGLISATKAIQGLPEEQAKPIFEAIFRQTVLGNKDAVTRIADDIEKGLSFDEIINKNIIKSEGQSVAFIDKGEASQVFNRFITEQEYQKIIEVDKKNASGWTKIETPTGTVYRERKAYIEPYNGFTRNNAELDLNTLKINKLGVQVEIAGETRQIKNGDKITKEEFDSLREKDKAVFEATKNKEDYVARVNMSEEEKQWNMKNHTGTEDRDVIKQGLEGEVSPELLGVVDTLDEILGNIFVSANCNVL